MTNVNEALDRARALLDRGGNVADIAKATGLTNEQVMRVAKQRAQAANLGAQSADEPAPHPEAPAPVRRPVNRKPFGAHEQRLAAPNRPGYFRYWFNDEPGRIERAIEAGYDHVKDADGRPINRVVGKTGAGSGLIAYLMECPEEFYNEDMAAAQQERDATMAAIRRGDHKSPDNAYVPQQGIRIDRR